MCLLSVIINTMAESSLRRKGLVSHTAYSPSLRKSGRGLKAGTKADA